MAAKVVFGFGVVDWRLVCVWAAFVVNSVEHRDGIVFYYVLYF